MKRADWRRGIFASLDTETTGVNPQQARIAQAALALVDSDGEVITKYETFVDPGIDIPEDAASVHGITTDIVRELGVHPSEMLADLAGMLLDLSSVGEPLVIFNATYDWSLLLAEARRHAIEIPHVHILDPLVLDRRLDPRRKGSRRLSDVASHYGYALGDDAHSALADCLASAAVLRALILKHPAIFEEMTIEDLQEAQARWHKEWADELNAYWRRIGSPKRVEGDWPGVEPATHT